ncbi:hypothetical protein NSP33_24630, partial [Salmonella enterica]|nr:hypothetical protein [Salmonella enterica]
EKNPRENASAVTLRSGKQFELQPKKYPPQDEAAESSSSKNDPIPTSSQQDATQKVSDPKLNVPSFVTPPPFPSRLRKSKKDEV